MNTLRKKYEEQVVPALKEKFKYQSSMQVPRLKKIVVNCGVGDTTTNIKAIDYAVYMVSQISGQKPLVTKSKKAIANFKLRAGLPIGAVATIRGERMYDMFERLIAYALPRQRDFRGVPVRGFDGRGNYTMGVLEGTIFPEVMMEKMDKTRGLDITFVTTAQNDEEGRELLTSLGMPFRKPQPVQS